MARMKTYPIDLTYAWMTPSCIAGGRVNITVTLSLTASATSDGNSGAYLVSCVVSEFEKMVPAILEVSYRPVSE